jgi:ABC-type glycerol-3-phosphate transport system permease component
LRLAGTYALLTLGAVVAILPFLYTISVSLMNLTEANGGACAAAPPKWNNYLDAWNQGHFSNYFWNSVRIAAITVAGELLFCTLAAYAFARMEFWGKNLLFSLLLATLMLPEAITWVPNFITVSWLGRVGPVPWINNWPALTVPFMASAFSIFLLRQFFLQVPNDLWDSAQIEQAQPPALSACRSSCPFPKAALMTLVLFGFIGSWNALAWPILVTTTPEWRPITYGFFAFADEAGAQFHLQMAGSVLTMAPVVLLYFYTANLHRRNCNVRAQRVTGSCWGSPVGC